MSEGHPGLFGPGAWCTSPPKAHAPGVGKPQGGEHLHLAWRELLPPWLPPPPLEEQLGMADPLPTPIYSGRRKEEEDQSILGRRLSQLPPSLPRRRFAKSCYSSAATTTTMPSCWPRSHLPLHACLLDQEGRDVTEPYVCTSWEVPFVRCSDWIGSRRCTTTPTTISRSLTILAYKGM
jgi:hypothetical protein